MHLQAKKVDYAQYVQFKIQPVVQETFSHEQV